MVFVSHTYGSYKHEMKLLLRERLKVKERLRHHEKKLSVYVQRLREIEVGLQELEQRSLPVCSHVSGAQDLNREYSVCEVKKDGKDTTDEYRNETQPQLSDG